MDTTDRLKQRNPAPETAQPETHHQPGYGASCCPACLAAAERKAALIMLSIDWGARRRTWRA